MTEHKSRNLLITALAVLVLGVFILLWLADVPRFLRTQVLQPLSEQQVERTLKLTIPEDAPPGPQIFRIQVEDQSDQTLLAQSEEITVVVQGDGMPDTPGSPDDPGRPPTPVKPPHTFIYAPERDHVISGRFSGIGRAGGHEIVILGDSEAVLEKQVSVPRDNYWLYISAKHDTPSPVDIGIYLNDKAWKAVRLGQGDNLYRTHRVGLLRDFDGGTIRFRLLNEPEDRTSIEDDNRTLSLYAWGLSTNANLRSIRKTGAQGSAGRSPGWELLPGLNQSIRQHLGEEHVNFEMWLYYAQRVTASARHPHSILTAEHLRVIMEYWKKINPDNPRGEFIFLP